MTRLQRKCLVVSLVFHGVLMGAVVVTAAFRSEPTISGEPILTLISPNILDRPGVGGPRGAPPRHTPDPINHSPPTPPPPAPAPAQTHPSETHPAMRQAEPPASSRRSSPRQTHDEPRIANTKSATETAPKHTITPDFTPVQSSGKSASRNSTSRNSSSASPSHSDSQAEKNRRVQEIESAIAALSSSLDSKEPASKVVPLPGLDDGQAFVNYRTAVFNAYYHAWITPDDTTHKNAVADVKIVVARDGSIISSEIVTKSGDANIDRSVQRALDAVPRLPPFPTATTDPERTFIIRFNLEAKESAG